MEEKLPIIGLLDPADYPESDEKLINAFNEKLLAVAEGEARLTDTVSQKDQRKQNIISDSLRVYNVNISKDLIEDEIFEHVEDRDLPLFKSMGLPNPCPLKAFVSVCVKSRICDDYKEKFAEYFDAERLTEEFAKGRVDQTLDYFCTDGLEIKRYVHHTMLLSRHADTGDIIAHCNARDITGELEAQNELTQAREEVETGHDVIDTLAQDYNAIWIVDADSLKMQLYRYNENHGDQLAAKIDKNAEYYPTAMSEYIDRCVSELNRTRLGIETDLNTVIKRIKSGNTYKINYLVTTEDGDDYYNQMSFTKLNKESRVTKIVLAFRNVDEEIKRELNNVVREERIKQYEQDQQVVELLHESIGSGQWNMSFDESGDMTRCSWMDNLRRLLGFENELDFPNTLDSWLDRICLEDHDRVLDLFWDAIKDKKDRVHFDINYRMYTKGNTLKWFRSAGRLTRRSDGSPITFTGLILDIDNRVKAENAVLNQLEIVDALARDYLDIFKINVDDGTCEIVKMAGYNTDGIKPVKDKLYKYMPVMKKYVKERVYPSDVNRVLAEMDLDNVMAMLRKNDEYSSSYKTMKDNAIHYFQFRFIMLKNRTGQDNIILAFKNIDEIVHAAKERDELIELSETDTMTKLLNRRSGEAKVNEALKIGKAGMLCIFDIDKFKSVNDTYGHNSGDKVICGVAECMRKAFREHDIVFRLGGDEFVAFAENVGDEETGRRLMDRLFAGLSKLNIREIGGRAITISVGAVIVGPSNSKTFAELYKQADMATYESKNEKGNALSFYR